MSIVTAVFVLLCIGALYWAVKKIAPESPITQIALWLIVAVAVLWILKVVGVFDALSGVMVPTVPVTPRR